MKRDVKLFWRVMRPLAVTFALLWLGIMAVVIQWTCQRLEGDVEAGIQRAETEIDRLWENYQVNQSEERAAILRVGLNHAAQSLSDLDGGMALMIWAGGREFRCVFREFFPIPVPARRFCARLSRRRVPAPFRMPGASKLSADGHRPRISPLHS